MCFHEFELNDYEALAEEMLTTAAERLPDGVNLSYFIFFENQCATMELSAAATNSPGSKQRSAAMVRELVKEKNAQAVIAISDIWMANSDVRDAATTAKIKELGLPAAQDAGLVTLREALYCRIETAKHGDVDIFQHYRRTANQRDIVLEERTVKRGTEHFGRLSSFFAQEANA